MNTKISSALISVFHKEGLEPLMEVLKTHDVTCYSTGGTQKYLEEHGLKVVPVEEITGYPSVFGGRVKTLHPAVFGGILNRRDHEGDQAEKAEHKIPDLDLVVVDLYPFEQTVASGAPEQDIIEKIDIGGISLIRAAAKNFKDVLCISQASQYDKVAHLLKSQAGETTLEQRKAFAAEAFAVSSHYDTHIFNYLNQEPQVPAFRATANEGQVLRYGENPHQSATFYGKLEDTFEILGGKALSYNNLVDTEACVQGMFDVETFSGNSKANCIIIKHTNACGWAFGDTVAEAYTKALAGDPVSAFGGIIGINQPIDLATAEKLHELFFEILVAPGFAPEALALLQEKKNRRILRIKQFPKDKKQFRNMFDGVLEQDLDQVVDKAEELETVTKATLNEAQTQDLLFASLVAKNSKSNTIILVKDQQLIGSGVGQTSRVDAARQAIEKAQKFGFDTKGAVMASDAFFPFPDCVEIAGEAGVSAIVQPGGSIKDKDSIAKADELGIAMAMTGRRHFKH